MPPVHVMREGGREGERESDEIKHTNKHYSTSLAYPEESSDYCSTELQSNK